MQQRSLSGRVDPHQDSDPTGRSRVGTPSRCHAFGPTHWPTTIWVAVASGPSHTRSISPEYFAAVTLSTWSWGMPSVTVLIGCARPTLVDGTAAWAPPPARVVPLVARWSPRPIATTRARGMMVRLWLSGRLPAPLAVATTRTQSFGRRAPETAVSGRTATVTASVPGCNSGWSTGPSSGQTNTWSRKGPGGWSHAQRDVAGTCRSSRRRHLLEHRCAVAAVSWRRGVHSRPTRARGPPDSAGPTPDGCRHLPSRLARTPDVIQDPSLQRLCVRSDSRTDVLVVTTISSCGLQLPSSCRCRLSGLVASPGVSISSDRDTAAKPPGHAQASSGRVLIATDEHEPGLDANA